MSDATGGFSRLRYERTLRSETRKHRQTWSSGSKRGSVRGTLDPSNGEWQPRHSAESTGSGEFCTPRTGAVDRITVVAIVRARKLWCQRLSPMSAVVTRRSACVDRLAVGASPNGGRCGCVCVS